MPKSKPNRKRPKPRRKTPKRRRPVPVPVERDRMETWTDCPDGIWIDYDSSADTYDPSEKSSADTAVGATSACRRSSDKH